MTREELDFWDFDISIRYPLLRSSEDVSCMQREYIIYGPFDASSDSSEFTPTVPEQEKSILTISLGVLLWSLAIVLP